MSACGSGGGNGSPSLDFRVTTLPVSEHPNAMIAADLDGDGDGDLAVIGLLGEGVTVVEHTPDHLLVAWPAVPLPGGPLGAASGDFDADGRIDLAATLPGAGQVRILRGTLTQRGSPSFAPVADIPVAAPFAIAAGDLDGDGDDDLLVTSFASGELTLLEGSPIGAFAVAATLPGPPGASAAVIADLDGDGHADAAVTGAGNGNEPGEVRVYRGDGALGLTPAPELGGQVGVWPSAIVAAQLDADPALELLGTANLGDELFVLDQGTLSTLPTGAGPIALAVADLDADAAAEVLVANKFENTLSIFASEPRGVPGPPAVELARLPTGDGPTPVAAIDLDGDGRLDLAVADGFSNDVVLFLTR